MVVGTPLLAAHAFTFLPLATLPVKATLASRLSELHDTLCLWSAGPLRAVFIIKSFSSYLQDFWLSRLLLMAQHT